MKFTAIADRGLIRLIPQTRHKPPVLRGLVGSDEEAEILAELEGRTAARRIAESESQPGLDRRELAFRRHSADLRAYGYVQVNAAFAYTRPEGNRFNTGARGAWYCSYDDLTSCHEVGFHRTRELEHVGRYEDEAIYVALLADFIGEFPDLRGARTAALHPDPEIGYPAGQDLAAELQGRGHAGLLYPSARRAGGTCFVAFEPQIVQNVRPGASWRLRWTGTPAFTIEGI